MKWSGVESANTHTSASIQLRAIALTLAGVVLLFAGVYRITTIIPERENRNDFAHYYASSRALVEGRDPFGISLQAEFERFGFQIGAPEFPLGATNPPPLLYMFAPFAAQSPRTAYYAWVGVQALILGLLLGLVGWLMRGRISGPSFALFSGAVVFSNAVWLHFYFSQVQLLLGLLLLGGLALQERRRYSLAWVAITAAGLLKIFPFAVLPWFVWRAKGSLGDRLRWLVPSLVLGIGVVVSTWSLWAGFWESGAHVIRGHAANQTFNFSLPSFLLNLFLAARGFQKGLPDLAWGAASLASLVLIASTYAIVAQRGGDLRLEFCAILCASLAASLTAWPHYFVLLVFPWVLLVAKAEENKDPNEFLLVLLTYFFGLLLLNGAGVTWLGIFAQILLGYMPLYVLLFLTFLFARRAGSGQQGDSTTVPARERLV